MAIRLTIKDALGQLDRGNNNHWTENGSPVVAVVSDILGRDVTRKEITDAAPGLTRDGEVNLEKPTDKVVEEVFEKEISDKEAIEKIENKIYAVYKEVEVLNIRIAKLKAEKSKLINSHRQTFDHEVDQLRRMSHIRRQNEIRQERAAKRAELIKNIDPALLAAASPTAAERPRPRTPVPLKGI